MKKACQILVFCMSLGIVIVGCRHGQAPAAPREIPLFYPNVRVLIEGEDKTVVKNRWGKPREKITNNFSKFDNWFYKLTLDKRKTLLPPHDEIWIYSVAPRSGERLVFLDKGVVTYCVEIGWSDY